MNEQLPSSVVPTSDERLMAAISHLFGLFVALVIWILQKERSHFVRFQAAQAMAFDVLVMIMVFVVAACLTILTVLGMMLGMGGMVVATDPSNTPDPGIIGLFFTLITSTSFLLPCAMFVLLGGVWGIRLIAAIRVFRGSDFHYPWLGAQVEKFLCS